MKIALIGCGRAAELIYLPALKKNPGIAVAAVIDPIRERRELISRYFPGSIAKENLDDELINNIDSGIILTPPHMHVPLALKLLEKNRYVLVEKPLSDSMNGIADLIKIESSSKGSLMMGFNHRYWEPAALLNRKLLGGAKIKSTEIIFTSSLAKWSPISIKSDLIEDLGPHIFDLIRFIFNKDIVSVSANSSKPDEIEMRVKLPDETQVNCRFAHAEKTSKTITVKIDKEKYFINLSSVRLTPEPGTARSTLDLSDKIRRKIFNKTSPLKKTYDIQLNNFFNFVRLNKSAVPGITDGIKAILAAKAVRASIKNGREVFLDELQ